MAIRHTVMIKLVKKEDKAKVAESLEKMAGGLSGVKWISFNVFTDLGLVETNADVTLVVDFPDKESYLAYASHPDHLSIINSNKPLVANRLAIQYDAPAKV
ncbi:unnamed protein product [Calypogeia fissa]